MPEKKQRSEWGSFIAVILFVALMAVWALIPCKVLEATWQSEQTQMSTWAGKGVNHWIMSKATDMMNSAARDAGTAASGLGDSAIEHWLMDRIYASLLWANIIVYRTQALLMWGLLGIPLMMAASVDGFYVREVRKTSFISQSPIRHKIGVHFLWLVTMAMSAWLCLPIPAPIFAAPLVILFAAASFWLWVSNLQKRL
ncbi:MAG: DUF4400 domain-containing protein [Pseudomonadota bacterium]|nr:DUF4400 domain-containing protein [Pseudomonadota bacterium]MDP1904185.1 DUF4400 domain-containing protein [Pseudomonadota bacterium]